MFVNSAPVHRSAQIQGSKREKPSATAARCSRQIQLGYNSGIFQIKLMITISDGHNSNKCIITINDVHQYRFSKLN